MTTTLAVPIEPPFRFDLAIRYLQRSPDEIIDLVRDGCHYRVLPGIGGAALVEISTDGIPGNPALRARVLSGEIDSPTLQAALRRIYQPDGGRRDYEPGEALAARLYAQFRGLPVVQTLTPWEALVWAIIGQQINIAFAYRLKRAFTEQFGSRIRYNGHDFFSFPDPERVATLDHERDLLPIQFSRQKSRYIIEAARSVLGGDLDFEWISTLDDEAASAALQQQLGVGRWTAEYVLLRGFGRLDVIPAGDAALKANVGRHLELGRPATEDEVRELAEQWIPRRGEAAFMLWFAGQAGWFRD